MRYGCRLQALILVSAVVVVLAGLTGCGGTVAAAPKPGSSPSGGSTTLQAETANNTSASDSFAGQPNELPKPGNVSKVDTHTLLYPGSTTKIYAGMVGWFGDPGHMNVGYRSDDPQQVKKQVEDMQSRGIQGAILDWFGASNTTINNTALALRTQAEAHAGFQFAIMEDAGALVQAAKANGCDVTSQLLSDLTYINTQFVPSSAYIRMNGRPVIFFFGVDAYYIDWNRVRASVANNPLFLFRGADGLTRPISDGGFQWLDINADPFHPASPNPFDPSLTAQQAFYQTNTQGRISIGSVYRGFNDSLAQWGIDRFMQPRCGQTWLDTFAIIPKFYSSSNQLTALQIVTWNDYDEGSAMEMGIDNCVYIQPNASGSTLTWNIGGGPEATIDHYSVFSTTDGTNLTKLADVPSGTHSLDLSPFKLTTQSLYVKAVGKPSILNKMSPPLAFRAGHQSPAAKLAVSQTGPLTYTVSTAASTASSGSIAASTIDFGDGSVVNGPTATHTYRNVGIYSIAATVADNAGASSVAIQPVSAKGTAPGVTIYSPSQAGVVNWPNPNFVASGNGASPIVRMNVLVDGTQIYSIDRDVITTPLKIYSGNHHVEFQAVDSSGAVSRSAVDITAEPNDPAPTPSIQTTPLPQAGANTLLFCGANWQDPDRFVNAYRWTFSDGSAPAFIPSVVHTFPTGGTFSINQYVINQFGTPGSVTQSVNASVPSLAPSSSVYTEDEKTQKLNVPMRKP